MKKIILNWKNYMESEGEIVAWFEKLVQSELKVNFDRFEIFLAPSDIHLHLCKRIIDQKSLPIKLMSQHLPITNKVPSTGEALWSSLSELVGAGMVGHSERRALGESQIQIAKQLELAKEYHIKTFLCISRLDQIMTDADFLCYEPLESIGNGKIASTQQINDFYQQASMGFDKAILYGGSIDANDAGQLLEFLPQLEGLLIGHASTKAEEVIKILNSL